MGEGRREKTDFFTSLWLQFCFLWGRGCHGLVLIIFYMNTLTTVNILVVFQNFYQTGNFCVVICFWSSLLQPYHAFIIKKKKKEKKRKENAVTTTVNAQIQIHHLTSGTSTLDGHEARP